MVQKLGSPVTIYLNKGTLFWVGYFTREPISNKREKGTTGLPSTKMERKWTKAPPWPRDLPARDGRYQHRGLTK